MVDYETVSQNAVRHGFPAVQLVGCLFHLGQCFWGKVQELPQWRTAIRDDDNIRDHVKKLLALSFVRSVDNTNALGMLVKGCLGGIDPVPQYWVDNYIGGQRPNGRAEPRFEYGNTETFDYLRGLAYLKLYLISLNVTNSM